MTTDNPATFPLRESALLAPAPTTETIKRRTFLPFAKRRTGSVSREADKQLRGAAE